MNAGEKKMTTLNESGHRLPAKSLKRLFGSTCRTTPYNVQTLEK
jgi:hypothetical protein